METKYNTILRQAANLADNNPDIGNAVKRMCFEWSDKQCDSLPETYEYLKNSKPDDLKDFMNGLAYMAKVGN